MTNITLSFWFCYLVRLHHRMKSIIIQQESIIINKIGVVK